MSSMYATCTRTPSADGNTSCSGWACNFDGNKLLGEQLLSVDRMTQRENNCRTIGTILKTDSSKMTLVTGAGISIPAGLPNWYKLVSQMLGSALYTGACSSNTPPNENQLTLYHAMMSGNLSILNGTNTLESAEYIAKVLQQERDIHDSKQLETRILQSLIAPMIQAGKGATQFLAEHPDKKSNPIKLAVETNSSLAATAYLMYHPEGFRRAMTYNYDTLLQQYITGVFGLPEVELVTHVERMTEKPGASREVFHLHGCIPSEGYDKYTYGTLSHDLILSEDSYYEVEKQGSYNWFNTVQSYYLNNSSCVFVGFSGEDYNFRRILRQLGHQPHGKHYIVVTIGDLYKDLYKSICQFHHNKNGTLKKAPVEIAEQAKILLNDILYTKESYWGSYGFTPIWVTVDDIPSVLVSMLPN